MYTILAIETSTQLGSVALSSGGEVCERILPADKPGSETLLPAIDSLLRERGIEKRSLEAVAAGTGPGSFTGLRVGLATAKGIASVLGVPTVPVPSLDALVLPCLDTGCSAVAVADARKGEVYAACYSGLDPSRIPDVKAGPVLLTPAEFKTWFDELDCPPGTRAAGTGLHLVAGAFGDGEVIDEPGNQGSIPRASIVLELGSRLLQLGRSVDAAGLIPCYVRAPDAILPK